MSTLKNLSCTYESDLRLICKRKRNVSFEKLSKYSYLIYFAPEYYGMNTKIKYCNIRDNKINYVSERPYIDVLRDARWYKPKPIIRIRRRVNKISEFVLTMMAG